MADPTLTRLPSDIATPLKTLAEQASIPWPELLAAALLIGIVIMLRQGLEKSVAEVSEMRKEAKRVADSEVEAKIAPSKHAAEAEIKARLAPLLQEAKSSASVKAFDAMIKSLSSKMPVENHAA